MEYRSAGQNKLRFQEHAAWSAFQGLQDFGILAPLHGRANAKLPAKEMPFVLAVSTEQIAEGAKHNEAYGASISDALQGVAGMQRMEASAF